MSKRDYVAELVSKLQYTNFHVVKLQEMRDAVTGVVSIDLRVELVLESDNDE
jgi:hypothetical protein